MQLSLFSYDTLVSAKRTKNERSGVHAWHPYYAGYAEDFVSSAIEYLHLQPGEFVLDPWNGSGTTAVVGARHNLNTIGLDVNPVMNIFSMSKTGYSLAKSDSIYNNAREIVEKLKDRGLDISLTQNDPLLDFMSPSLCKLTRTTHQIIQEKFDAYEKIEENFSNVFSDSYNMSNPIQDFLTAGLFITSRKLAGYKGGSNPTWVKTLDKKNPVKSENFTKTYLNQITTMINELKNAGIEKTPSVKHIARNADSRSLPLKSESVDGIITSPPYLTRIDYAMSTRPELLILSDEKELRRIRELTMGAPVIVDKKITPKKNWGEICNKILASVENHTSKAAKSYYYPNMLQYFRDAEQSMKEIVRVLKPNKKALVVVQSSYFKEHEIPLGEIYVEMCTLMGAKAKIQHRDLVKGHMAHLNLKSNSYIRKKIFYEDVVEVEKI